MGWLVWGGVWALRFLFCCCLLASALFYVSCLLASGLAAGAGVLFVGGSTGC